MQHSDLLSPWPHLTSVPWKRERGQRSSGSRANSVQSDTASHPGVSNRLPASPPLLFVFREDKKNKRRRVSAASRLQGWGQMLSVKMLCDVLISLIWVGWEFFNYPCTGGVEIQIVRLCGRPHIQDRDILLYRKWCQNQEVKSLDVPVVFVWKDDDDCCLMLTDWLCVFPHPGVTATAMSQQWHLFLSFCLLPGLHHQSVLERWQHWKYFQTLQQVLWPAGE